MVQSKSKSQEGEDSKGDDMPKEKPKGDAVEDAGGVPKAKTPANQYSWRYWNAKPDPDPQEALKKIEDASDHPLYDQMVERFLGNAEDNEKKYHKMWKDHADW